MVRNGYISETQLIATAAQEIGARLPPRWHSGVYSTGRKAQPGAPRRTPSPQDFEAVWEIRDPDGLSSDVIVEVQAKPLEPTFVGRVVSLLKALSNSGNEQVAAPPAFMLVSSYLSPLTRERLAEAGISYADSTGNIRFSVDRPAVFIETQGAEKNPFREERALRSLKGGRAARVARGLLDYRTPFGTRELAAEIASSPAMVSRVCGLLEPDEIVTKESPRGRIVSVDWEALARRWAVDYDFASSNTLATWLEPRGTGALFARLREATFRYTVTGSFAAYRLAPIAEPRLATLYVDEPETAAQTLGLRPAETGGNVLLAIPFDPVAFERAEYDDGIAYPCHADPAGSHQGDGAGTGGGGGPLRVDAGQ